MTITLTPHSLLLRLALVLSLIAVIILSASTASVLIAQQLRGAATAINHAGTLRYASYYASTTALFPGPRDTPEYAEHLGAAIERFERHYHSQPMQDLAAHSPSHALRQAYADIGLHWSQVVKPLIVNAQHQIPDAAYYQQLRDVVDAFVRQVDAMVILLEQRTEAQVRTLRLTQAIALTLGLLIGALSLRFLYRDVLRPLQALLAGAHAIGRGQFRHKIAHTGPDELGQLGQVFNAMATDLGQMYGQLEQRVQEKTQALELRHRALELMYQSLNQVHRPTLPHQPPYADILRQLEHMLDLEPDSLTLRLREFRGDGRLVSTAKIPGCPGTLCHAFSNCNDCLNAMGPGLREFSNSNGTPLLAVPLHDGLQVLGLLQIRLPGAITLSPWQIPLVEAIGQHLGLAIASERRVVQDRRIALLEERTTIARELHDSLAQSLSFLKIEFSLLRKALAQNQAESRTPQILADIQEGLTEAYQHLRSLLTTFRVDNPGHDGLNALLAHVVERTERHSDLHVELHNPILDGTLTPNEEMHLLHIVREALSNIQRHAQASQCAVTLAWLANGQIELCITDNGLGLPEEALRKPGHYGLISIRERVRQLRGHLMINPHTDPASHAALQAAAKIGTRLCILFHPLRTQAVLS